MEIRIRSRRRWARRLCCVPLLWALSAAAAPAVPTGAASVGETIIVDNAFKELRLAIFRRPFQRIPEADELPFWIDPKAEAPELRFNAQRTLFGQDVLWIDPITHGKVSMARAERMAAVSALVTPERMLPLIREAVAEADRVAGASASRVVFAREAGKAQVAQVLVDRDSGHAMTIQGPVYASHLPDPGGVQLSWDDRQILITLRIQRFRKVRGKHLSIRDLGPLTAYHYVGPPLPAGVDPIAHWTRNDGAPLLAALREGFTRMMVAARSPLPDGAAAAPASTAVVMVGDRLQRFPGTVIDRGDGVARLRLGKAELLLVATGTQP